MESRWTFIVGHFAPGEFNMSGGTVEGGYTVVANNPGSGGSVWNLSGGLFVCRNDPECGDDDEATINHSGRVDLTDGVVLLDFLFSGASEPPCLDAVDADDQNNLNVTDAAFVFSYLFSGGTAPPPPSPTGTSATEAECGVDPTRDDIGCAAAPAYCG